MSASTYAESYRTPGRGRSIGSLGNRKSRSPSYRLPQPSVGARRGALSTRVKTARKQRESTTGWIRSHIRGTGTTPSSSRTVRVVPIKKGEKKKKNKFEELRELEAKYKAQKERRKALESTSDKNETDLLDAFVNEDVAHVEMLALQAVIEHEGKAQRLETAKAVLDQKLEVQANAITRYKELEDKANKLGETKARLDTELAELANDERKDADKSGEEYKAWETELSSLKEKHARVDAEAKAASKDERKYGERIPDTGKYSNDVTDAEKENLWAGELENHVESVYEEVEKSSDVRAAAIAVLRILTEWKTYFGKCEVWWEERQSEGAEGADDKVAAYSTKLDGVTKEIYEDLEPRLERFNGLIDGYGKQLHEKVKEQSKAFEAILHTISEIRRAIGDREPQIDDESGEVLSTLDAQVNDIKGLLKQNELLMGAQIQLWATEDDLRELGGGRIAEHDKVLRQKDSKEEEVRFLSTDIQRHLDHVIPPIEALAKKKTKGAGAVLSEAKGLSVQVKRQIRTLTTEIAQLEKHYKSFTGPHESDEDEDSPALFGDDDDGD